MNARFTVVIGGASSGKSSWAEARAESLDLPKVYIATARIWDDEVQDRVLAHRKQRGTGWETRENALNPAAELAGLPPDRAVLLDCATMWLMNLIEAEQDVDAAAERLIDAIEACEAPVIVVTNEVGQGIVPDNAMARRFRIHQGRLNAMIAARADLVVQVVAGLPNVLKGSL